MRLSDLLLLRVGAMTNRKVEQANIIEYFRKRSVSEFIGHISKQIIARKEICLLHSEVGSVSEI